MKKCCPPENAVKYIFSDSRIAFSFFSSKEPNRSVNCAGLTANVISKNSPRYASQEMMKARKTEMKGSVECGAFEVVGIEEIPSDANELSDRFVLAIKTADGSVKY